MPSSSLTSHINITIIIFHRHQTPNIFSHIHHITQLSPLTHPQPMHHVTPLLLIPSFNHILTPIPPSSSRLSSSRNCLTPNPTISSYIITITPPSITTPSSHRHHHQHHLITFSIISTPHFFIII